MQDSWISVQRVLRRQMAKDPALRRSAELSGRPLPSHVEALTDEQAIAKLAALGVPIDRARLDEASRRCLSAQEFVEPLVEALPKGRGRFDTDWIWLLVTTLWQRWFPERPILETLDDKMQEGYDFQLEDRDVECAERWLSAWKDLLRIAEDHGLRTLEDLDKRLETTQFPSNWVQDVEMALSNAARDDPRFHRERIAFAREFLDRFGGDERHLSQQMLRTIAEAHFDLGEIEAGDALFRQQLEEDPTWGWGWIGWSDAYYIFAPKDRKDAVRAEAILKQGLAVENLRERPDLLERLESLYEETGRPEEAAAARKERKRLRAEARRSLVPEGSEAVELPGDSGGSFDDDEGPPPEPMRREAPKVGRNDPCPCGSGKKHKKCCGK